MLIFSLLRLVVACSVLLLSGLVRGQAGEDRRQLTMEAISFHGKNMDNPDAIHFEQSPDGYYFPASVVDLKQLIALPVVEPMTRRIQYSTVNSMFYPGYASLIRTFEHGSIDAEKFNREVFGRVYADPAQVFFVSLGEWISESTWRFLAETTRELHDFPFFTYFRARPRVRGTDVMQLADDLNAGRNDTAELEFHVIKAGLAVIAAQVMVSPRDVSSSRATFKRVPMPWQEVDYLREDFEFSDGMLGWELSRAVQIEPSLFKKLLPVATLTALNESLAYGVPLDKAMFFVHCPDRKHAIIYAGMGFRRLSPESRIKDGQYTLFGLSLLEALALDLFKPSGILAKLHDVVTQSQQQLSDKDALRFLIDVKQLMTAELDVIRDSVVDDKPLMVVDRSIGFYQAADLLLPAYGFGGANGEVLKDSLRRYTRISGDKAIKDDVFFLPELVQHPSREALHSLSVFNLNRNLAMSNAFYLEDILSDLLTWEELRTFASFSSSTRYDFDHEFLVTAYTRHADLARQLASLGGVYHELSFARASIDATGYAPLVLSDTNTAFGIRFHASQLRLLRDRVNSRGRQFSVRQDSWARKSRICSSTFH